MWSIAIDWFHSVLRDTGTLRNELGALAHVTSVRSGLNHDLLLARDLLGSSELPVSFLWGANDPMGGPDVAPSFVAQIPGAEHAHGSTTSTGRPTLCEGSRRPMPDSTERSRPSGMPRR